MKKLSIITINYNNLEGLKRTFNSIIPKKDDSFEYIVIDGNSTDGSSELIKKHSSQIDYWVSESDRGIYHAMNKGIGKASGEYLLFINSGDEIAPHIDLNKVIDQLTEEEIIFYNIIEIIDIEKNISITKRLPNTLDFRFFIQDALPHQSTLIKRECLINYGGYSEKMKIFSDWAFFMDAICKLELSYKHVDEELALFYQDGISSKPENRAILWSELKQYVETNYPIYKRLYNEWDDQRIELHKLRSAKSIQWIKKIGLLKWFRVYTD